MPSGIAARAIGYTKGSRVSGAGIFPRPRTAAEGALSLIKALSEVGVQGLSGQLAKGEWR